ncbi:MAG: hypothetical protein AAF914_00410 [Pseudomonadota bacterium]
MREVLVISAVMVALALSGLRGEGQVAMLDVPPALPASISPF